MNREIKFRAKRVDNGGEWVYGVPVQSNYGLSIVSSIYHVDCAEYNVNEHTVIPETIGQYTGLKDKNGKEIYEGDILTWSGEFGDSGPMVWIEWELEDAKFYVTSNNGYGGALSEFIYDCEVVGNIFENPELLTP